MQPAFDYVSTPAPNRSAVDALLSAARALLPIHPPRALEMAVDALGMAQTVQYRAGLAQAHLLAGQTLHRLARLQDATVHLQDAAHLFSELNASLGEAQAFLTLGTVTRELGEAASAEALFGRAFDLGLQLGDLNLQASVLNHQAALAQTGGNADLALQRLSSALTLRQQLGDALGAAQCLNNIGQVHLNRNDLGTALTTLTEAFELLKTVDDPTTTAHCLINIAYVHEELGDHQRSYEYHDRALGLARTQGNHTLELYCLNNLAEAVSSLQRHQEAARLFTEALSMAEGIGIPHLIACAQHGLGRSALGGGHPAEALVHYQRALDVVQSLGDQRNELEALLGLGAACIDLQRHPVAQAYLHRALPLALELQLPRQEAQVRVFLARIAQQLGATHEALDHLWTVRELERQLFDRERDRQAQQLTVQFDVERAHHEAAVSHGQTEIATQAFQAAEAKVAAQTERLVQAQVEVVTRLAVAAEYRDDVTGEHTFRVGHLAALLATQLRLGAEEISLLRVAARLHDVGKIGIADAILQKPAKLTLEEYELMKSHTLIGGRILAGGSSPLLNMAEAIALGHHERWDGGGYPRGIRGEAIPLVARIVAVADVYDALSHARPYKRPWTQEEVLQEISRQSGRQFQPDIVSALMTLHAAGTLSFDTLTDDHRQVQEVLIQAGRSAPTALPAPQAPPGDARLTLQLQEVEGRYKEACQTIEQLQVAAYTDALTGLANRRAFEDELETEILHAVRHQYPLGVVSIDLDGLKLVNDQEGHERGDALLKATAQALRTHMGPAGRLYRIGGDEFAVIVKNLDVSRQQLFLSELNRAIVSAQTAGFPSASMSVGVASFPEEATLEGDLLRLSDQRMYASKVERRRQHSAARYAEQRPDTVGHP